MPFSFCVPGKPVPKARPRVCRNGITYTPKKTADYEKLIKNTFIETVRELEKKGVIKQGIFPLTQPLYIKVECFFDKPKKAKNNDFHVTKPDCDNLLKNLDALNRVAWMDDGQLVAVYCRKSYVGKETIEGKTINSPCMIITFLGAR